MNLSAQSSEETKKKVMVITYYWPPSGGSGVQRWLKFVKYLPAFGWEPYVFTPENPSFAIRDDSLFRDVPAEAEVIHLPIWEPYDLYFRITKKKARPADMVGTRRSSLFQRVSTWIRGNVIIPDPKVFWVRSAVTFLSQFLTDAGIRTIITTGPPHSMHLIGYYLKKRNPSLHWIADFRDPWSQWGFLDSVRAGRLAKTIHRHLEARVLKTADRLLTITPFYVKQFSELANRKVTLLTNGFDEDDFRHIRYKVPSKFTVRHVGIVNEKCDPRPFLSALREFANELTDARREIVLEFIGDVHGDVKEFVRSDDLLAQITVFSEAVPHSELIHLYGSSSVLLLVLHGYKDAEGYLPGKVFEYVATGLPVIGIGPESGDAAALLRETGGGVMIEAGNINAIKQSLLDNFRKWKTEGQQVTRSEGVMKYSRKSLAGKLADML